MKVSIFGMGYVGVVSGACLAQLGHEIVGVDRNAKKIELINAGLSPIVEEGVAERIAAAVDKGHLRATTDADEAVVNTDVSFISVGTPSAADGRPCLSIVDAVVSDIGRALRAKNAEHTVVMRSTVLPGTTEDHVLTGLIEHSGSKQ